MACESKTCGSSGAGSVMGFPSYPLSTGRPRFRYRKPPSPSPVDFRTRPAHATRAVRAWTGGVRGINLRGVLGLVEGPVDADREEDEEIDDPSQRGFIPAPFGDDGLIVIDLPLSVIGDLDGDCGVGPVDLAMLLASWGPCPEPCAPGDPQDTCDADFNGDCIVGPLDLANLLANWG